LKLIQQHNAPPTTGQLHVSAGYDDLWLWLRHHGCIFNDATHGP